MKRKSTLPKIVEHLTTTYESYVSFHDADPLGIAWHGNYVKFFEKGREAFGRKHKLDYGSIYDNGFSTPIVHLSCDYKVTLKYAEYFKVVTSIEKTSTAKVIMHYQVFNKDGLLACEGKTIQVFVDLKGELALYSPQFYEDWKKKVNY
ncbi:MAG: acyl-CoA thioesterase [Brumimicrobium sp.]|nr:acyl-CoA thioesterase [Brumimicrobium sp.]